MISGAKNTDNYASMMISGQLKPILRKIQQINIVSKTPVINFACLKHNIWKHFALTDLP